MSTFLTSLPDMVEGDEQKAVKHLRTVVRLLEKENAAFSKDCADKVSYQNKQAAMFREDNERLRIKFNEMTRPKVSVLAVLEEKQAQLHNTIDMYTSQIDEEEHEMEELDKAMTGFRIVVGDKIKGDKIQDALLTQGEKDERDKRREAAKAAREAAKAAAGN